MKKLYSKTQRLSDAKFRGQRAFVVEVLSSCSTPATVEDLVPMVDRDGRYSALLSEWAKENGGVKGSIRYHLRELSKRGMVKVTQCQESMRAQIVGWGNSQAIRIPRAMLDALQLNEGDEVNLMVENGKLCSASTCLIISPTAPVAPTTATLTATGGVLSKIA